MIDLGKIDMGSAIPGQSIEWQKAFKVYFFMNSEFKKKASKAGQAIAPPAAGLSLFVLRCNPAHENNQSHFGWYLNLKLGLDGHEQPVVEQCTKTDIILRHALRLPLTQSKPPEFPEVAAQERSIQYLSCFLAAPSNAKQPNKRTAIIPYFMSETQTRADFYIKYLCLSNLELCIPD